MPVSGILVAKKALFSNSVPNGCGGGTVFFVTQGGHRYLKVRSLKYYDVLYIMMLVAHEFVLIISLCI